MKPDWQKRVAWQLGRVLLLPLLMWARLPLTEMTRFTAPSQLLALIPGTLGILLRRVWYSRTLRRCGTNLTVDWLAVIRISDSSFGNNCTLGVGSWVGWVECGDDVITGDHVTLLSGATQHGLDDPDRPMRLQEGRKQRLVVGSDVWIGSHVVVMADITPRTAIGAGSVVTKTFDPGAIVAGNPARVLRIRGQRRYEGEGTTAVPGIFEAS